LLTGMHVRLFGAFLLRLPLLIGKRVLQLSGGPRK